MSLAALLRDAPEDVRARYSEFLQPEPRPAAPGARQPASAKGSRSSPPPPVAAGADGAAAAEALAEREDRRMRRAVAVAQLHAEFRDCCDIMGIGLGAPRGDTVAEVRQARARSH